MYAVLKTGGKQYKVQAGDVIQIEKLENDKGASVEFKEILFACKPSETDSEIFLGKPLLSGAIVKGEIVGQGRGDKILIVKYKRRKQYRRTKGHRQELTQVLVTSINNGSGATSELSAADKKAALGKFQSHLVLRGGRQKTALTKAERAAAAAEHSSGGSSGLASTGTKTAKAKTAAAPKKTAAKKTT